MSSSFPHPLALRRSTEREWLQPRIPFSAVLQIIGREEQQTNRNNNNENTAGLQGKCAVRPVHAGKCALHAAQIC